MTYSLQDENIVTTKDEDVGYFGSNLMINYSNNLQNLSNNSDMKFQTDQNRRQG